ncbi:hypothetical protein PCE1_000388 [Barthelona sp. PCE]
MGVLQVILGESRFTRSMHFFLGVQLRNGADEHQKYRTDVSNASETPEFSNVVFSWPFPRENRRSWDRYELVFEAFIVVRQASKGAKGDAKLFGRNKLDLRSFDRLKPLVTTISLMRKSKDKMVEAGTLSCTVKYVDNATVPQKVEQVRNDNKIRFSTYIYGIEGEMKVPTFVTMKSTMDVVKRKRSSATTRVSHTTNNPIWNTQLNVFLEDIVKEQLYLGVVNAESKKLVDRKLFSVDSMKPGIMKCLKTKLEKDSTVYMTFARVESYEDDLEIYGNNDRFRLEVWVGEFFQRMRMGDFIACVYLIDGEPTFENCTRLPWITEFDDENEEYKQFSRTVSVDKPCFDQRFIFSVSVEELERPAMKVVIDMYHKNDKSFNYRILGRGVIPLNDIVNVQMPRDSMGVEIPYQMLPITPVTKGEAEMNTNATIRLRSGEHWLKTLQKMRAVSEQGNMNLSDAVENSGVDKLDQINSQRSSIKETIPEGSQEGGSRASSPSTTTGTSQDENGMFKIEPSDNYKIRAESQLSNLTPTDSNPNTSRFHDIEEENGVPLTVPHPSKTTGNAMKNNGYRRKSRDSTRSQQSDEENSPRDGMNSSTSGRSARNERGERDPRDLRLNLGDPSEKDEEDIGRMSQRSHKEVNDLNYDEVDHFPSSRTGRRTDRGRNTERGYKSDRDRDRDRTDRDHDRDRDRTDRDRDRDRRKRRDYYSDDEDYYSDEDRPRSRPRSHRRRDSYDDYERGRNRSRSRHSRSRSRESRDGRYSSRSTYRDRNRDRDRDRGYSRGSQDSYHNYDIDQFRNEFQGNLGQDRKSLEIRIALLQTQLEEERKNMEMVREELRGIGDGKVDVKDLLELENLDQTEVIKEYLGLKKYLKSVVDQRKRLKGEIGTLQNQLQGISSKEASYAQKLASKTGKEKKYVKTIKLQERVIVELEKKLRKAEKKFGELQTTLKDELSETRRVLTSRSGPSKRSYSTESNSHTTTKTNKNSGLRHQPSQDVMTTVVTEEYTVNIPADADPEQYKNSAMLQGISPTKVTTTTHAEPVLNFDGSVSNASPQTMNGRVSSISRLMDVDPSWKEERQYLLSRLSRAERKAEKIQGEFQNLRHNLVDNMYNMRKEYEKALNSGRSAVSAQSSTRSTSRQSDKVVHNSGSVRKQNNDPYLEPLDDIGIEVAPAPLPPRTPTSAGGGRPVLSNVPSLELSLSKDPIVPIRSRPSSNQSHHSIDPLDQPVDHAMQPHVEDINPYSAMELDAVDRHLQSSGLDVSTTRSIESGYSEIRDVLSNQPSLGAISNHEPLE